MPGDSQTSKGKGKGKKRSKTNRTTSPSKALHNIDKLKEAIAGIFTSYLVEYERVTKPKRSRSGVESFNKLQGFFYLKKLKEMQQKAHAIIMAAYTNIAVAGTAKHIELLADQAIKTIQEAFQETEISKLSAVKALRKIKITAKQAITYHENHAYLNGSISHATGTVKDLVRKNPKLSINNKLFHESQFYEGIDDIMNQKAKVIEAPDTDLTNMDIFTYKYYNDALMMRNKMSSISKNKYVKGEK